MADVLVLYTRRPSVKESSAAHRHGSGDLRSFFENNLTRNRIDHDSRLHKSRIERRSSHRGERNNHESVNERLSRHLLRDSRLIERGPSVSHKVSRRHFLRASWKRLELVEGLDRRYRVNRALLQTVGLLHQNRLASRWQLVGC